MNLQRREEIRDMISDPDKYTKDPDLSGALIDALAYIDTLEQTAAERVIAAGMFAEIHKAVGVILSDPTMEINETALHDALGGEFVRIKDICVKVGAGPTPDYTGEGSAWVPPVEAREAKGPWESSKLDYDQSIHSNRDAKAWADFFVATYPGLADKHDIMLGWFANAMMAMHDSLKQEAPAVVVPERGIVRDLHGDPMRGLSLLMYCRGWDDLASRLCAIPADRVLGAGEIKGTPEKLAKIAEEAGWEWIRAPIESKKALVDWMADALRANQGGAAT